MIVDVTPEIEFAHAKCDTEFELVSDTSFRPQLKYLIFLAGTILRMLTVLQIKFS